MATVKTAFSPLSAAAALLPEEVSNVISWQKKSAAAEKDNTAAAAAVAAGSRSTKVSVMADKWLRSSSSSLFNGLAWLVGGEAIRIANSILKIWRYCCCWPSEIGKSRSTAAAAVLIKDRRRIFGNEP